MARYDFKHYTRRANGLIGSRASLLLIILIFSCGLEARGERRFEWYVTTGGAFPTRDLNVRYNFGINGSLGMGIRIIRHFRVVTRFEAQSFTLDQNAFLDAVNGGSRTSLMFGADLRFYHDIEHWPVDPVVVVGGGLAYSSISQLTVGPDLYNSQTETKPYFNAGIGFDVAMTYRLSAYVSARYVQISSGYTRAEFVPLNVGIRYPTH